jgi:hypothetical protein
MGVRKAVTALKYRLGTSAEKTAILDLLVRSPAGAVAWQKGTPPRQHDPSG